MIGAGAQGRAQLDALVALRQIVEVRVHDSDPAAACALVEHARRQHQLEAQVSTRADTASSCDLLVVATWATGPVLFAGEVAPGTHITSLGADEPGKSELDPVLLDEALVVTDDEDLAAPTLSRVDATLRQVLRGEHPGRESTDQVTVYSPVGLPLQDCVIAWHAYRRAVAAGLGTSLHLEDDQETHATPSVPSRPRDAHR